MTLILGSGEVRRCVDLPSLIDHLETGVREMARGTVILPDRMNLRYGDKFFRLMPAALNETGLMGFKVFHGSGPSGVRYLTAVYDQNDGSLLALMDGHYLTAARTGAATAIATKYLSRPESAALAVFGSGLEAETNFEAVCAVRNIKRATVYSTNAERRGRFARLMTKRFGVPVTAGNSPRDCAKDADIVIVATNTIGRASPIAFEGKWMRPGMHVNSIGSTAPFLREVDAETFSRPDMVVVDASPAQVEAESGDVIAAIRSGDYRREGVLEIQDIVSGKAQGRKSHNDITLYKSVGNAMQDIVSGYSVYKKARDQGMGIDVGEFLEKKFVF
jgi:alanine dehydrogenase